MGVIMEKDPEAIYTAEELVDVLIADAKEYAPDACDSIMRNKHMNNIGPDVAIEPDLVDATIVDFINFVGSTRGLDVAMYTVDLKSKSDATGATCECCGEPIYDGGDPEKQLCKDCNERVVPMVLDYLTSRGLEIT